MLKGKFFLSSALCLGLLSLAWAIDLDRVEVPNEVPDEPLDIQAGRFEYIDGTILASGGVTSRFENVFIQADQMKGNPTTGDLHMEGNVVVERGPILWNGSSLDYNYITQKGNFGPSSLFFDPVRLNVDQVERVSTNEYFLQGARFTTCPLDHPHVSARAKSARLVGEEYLVAKGMKIYVKDVPIFYVPYWRHHLDRSVFTFEAGYGSEWGASLLTQTRLPVTQHVDSLTDINLYSKRGVAVGQGFEWNTDKLKGGVSALYLKDQDPKSKYDLPSIGSDRYRYKFEHIQNFTDTHYLNTEWNFLSDPAFLEEFAKDEYRHQSQPENYGSWVYGNSFVGSELFVSKQINNYYDNVDRIEYSADLYRTKLGKTPFYVQSENAIAHLERVYAETNTVGTAYDAVRLDSKNGIYLPLRYEFLNLVPRATYRASYYSKSNTGSEEVRLIPGAGMEVSFQATKILSEQSRWYGTGLRHKMEPYADYIYEDTSVGPQDLFEFDDVDQLDDENKVQLGFRNVLQTKRDGRLSRFIDLDIYTHYLIDKNGAQESFDSLFIDARMPLTKKTMVDIEGEYDWYKGKVDFFNTRISHKHADIVASLEHLFDLGEDVSLWTPRLELYPESRVSFETYARYEDKDNELQEIAVIGYMNWCCMRYGLGYHYYDDGEMGIMFSVGLSAFPEARLSSGL